MRCVQSFAFLTLTALSVSPLRAVDPPMATVVRGAPQMSFEQCKANVQAALATEGVGDLRDFGNGWLGWTSTYGVSAGCIQGDKQTVVVITTSGRDPIQPRDRLLALIFSEGRCGDLTGTWNWFNGLVVTIATDGRFRSTAGVSGKWSPIDASRRMYRLQWDNGFVDSVSLSRDGAALSGSNESGARVSATRNCAGGTEPPVGSGGSNPGGGKPAPSGVACSTLDGEWSWFTGAKVTFRDDGTFLSSVNGRWSRAADGQFTIRWDNGYVDVLRLSPDGRRLSGKNAQGTVISGDRTTACEGAGNSNATTSAGGACSDPRTMARIDEWLTRASPPENREPGWSVRYEPWGRIIGRTPTNTIATSGPPDTSLTRCEYLLARAASLRSINLGTLRDYLSR
ncbi:MAG: eukaryotic-like serine/threonine-protein kinase [Thermoanaerobaculia bacterium]|jgi:hypothetical protein|nr:eukaryotic-like serine/threonine-protein kinase [Thermoanaerobaculia bacterium]